MSTAGSLVPSVTVKKESQDTSPELSSSEKLDLSPLIPSSPSSTTSPHDNSKKFSLKISANDSAAKSNTKDICDIESLNQWQSSSTLDKDIYFEGGGDGLAEDMCPPLESGSFLVKRWATSLQNLLNDSEGSELFKLYLNNCGLKNQIQMVDFWYACRGLKMVEDMNGTISVIWNRYIKSNVIKISDDLKTDLKRKILTEKSFGPSIFDGAQREVETLMSNIYSNFLKSPYCAAQIYGNDLVDYNTEDQNLVVVSSLLPTLPEESECSVTQSKPSVRLKFSSSRLTADNILASEKCRLDNIRLEGTGGRTFLRNLESNPFHPGYLSGHAVSQRDSEIQSMSSGGVRRDRSGSSCQSGSLDGGQLSSRQQIKKLAQLNKEEFCNSTYVKTSYVIPRTMTNAPRSGPSATTNPTEFFKVLTDKLDRVLEDRKNNERIQHSLRILSQIDNPEASRRDYATSMCPPNLLRNKLEESRIQDETPKQSDQSILDNHIKSWDPTTASPKNSPPNRELRGCQFPRFNHFMTSTLSKGKNGKASSAPQSVIGTPIDGPPTRNIYPGRRRENVNDVYSNFSSDSGNVADCPPSHIPKSASMPVYNEIQQATSDGGSSGKRRQISGNRRSGRRPPGDLTDSGVSDSGRSIAPSTSHKNSSREKEQNYRFRKGKPVPHNLSLSSSSLTQKSQCSSSSASNTTVIDTTTTSVAPLYQQVSNLELSHEKVSNLELSRDKVSYLELSRDNPLGQSQPYLYTEKKRNNNNGHHHHRSSGTTTKFTGDIDGSATTKDVTPTIYNYPDDSVPYVVKIQSKNVTLRMFKDHLPKTGPYRYFFKTIDEDFGKLVLLEVTEDNCEIPLYEGKVVSQICVD